MDAKMPERKVIPTRKPSVGALAAVMAMLGTKGGPLARKKKPSGRGDGKWQNQATIGRYRSSRDKKNKAARKARKQNR